jgi:hypothetical protein
MLAHQCFKGMYWGMDVTREISIIMYGEQIQQEYD